MAITKNAQKAERSSERKRIFNIRRKVTLHDTVKQYRDFMKAGKHAEAAALLSKVYKVIDKSEKRGIIKKNTASRKKSRLTLALKRATTK